MATIIGSNEHAASPIMNVCEEWYQEPVLKGEQYVSFCLDFCREHNIDVFMPRREMVSVSKYKDRFTDAGIKVMVDDYKYVSILNQKDKAYDFFREHSIGIIPDYYIATNVDHFKEAYEKLLQKYKWVCFKFVHDEGGKSYRLIDNHRKGYAALFKKQTTRISFDSAVDALSEKNSWFLPFNKGYNDGAGNTPNPEGLMTDYLWKNILTKEMLTLIIENYAQVVVEVDEDTKKKTEKQIFPHYHQLDVVMKLLADVQENGIGKRYLIQHSAGSGKSNSIAWLAHQLIGLEENGHPMIDSVLVVTDRRILDKQIRNTIKQFMQVKNTVVWAEHSGDLRKAIQDGKRIIITTVEKFPYIATEIGQEHRNNRFAIIIDEAHSGQSGRNSANMNLALSGLASDDEMDNEDKINALVEGRKLLTTASYFAFTATPKNKTEETVVLLQKSNS